MGNWLSRLIDRLRSGPSPARVLDEPPADRPEAPDDEAIVMPEIGPEIDLHTFRPQETRAVVISYLEEAVARGYTSVRIVHGRGKGVQRRIVRSTLEKHPLVTSFHDDYPGRGGWGATVANLRAP